MQKINNKPWWNRKYGKDSICPITKTRLRPGYSVFLRCGHGFSKNALETYIETGGTSRCPLCRAYFDPKLKFLK